VTVPNETRPTARKAAVYRLYAADGTLLYIGSSYDPDARCEVHQRKPWWPQVARRTEEWHPNRGRAYWEETAAINTEAPKHNHMGTPAYSAEASRRQQAAASELRVKCRVAAAALRIRTRVAREWLEEGHSEDRATAEGMLAERAYKEASGAFPNGVEYPPLSAVEMYLARAIVKGHSSSGTVRPKKKAEE
jgi:predicted GIY-YIG superfamily endonuclease